MCAMLLFQVFWSHKIKCEPVGYWLQKAMLVLSCNWSSML